MTDHPDFAYKLLTEDDVLKMRELGHTATAVDVSDGYVHLSTKAQLAETAKKYFAGQNGCLLMEIDTSARTDVKWEPSRGGDLFPHIYGPLRPADAVRNWTIDIPANGNPELPDDLK